MKAFIIALPLVLAAVPTSAQLVQLDDYPAAALREGRQGTVEMELTINQKGRVSGCDVTASSGHADLDAAACRIVQQRARYRPALDAAGVAIEASDKARISWVIPRQSRRTR